MVDDARTLQPTERALWEVPLLAGIATTIDVAGRSAFGYSIELFNLSLTDHIYYSPGDTTVLQGRLAQAILPGGTVIETPPLAGGHFTFICATDAKIDVVRA